MTRSAGAVSRVALAHHPFAVSANAGGRRWSEASSTAGYRADELRAPLSGAAGLSTAIVEALGHRQRGTISIDTAPGVMITITLRLAFDETNDVAV
jgi:hypothetical protein